MTQRIAPTIESEISTGTAGHRATPVAAILNRPTTPAHIVFRAAPVQQAPTRTERIAQRAPFRATQSPVACV
jgi:hypothetical protein